MEATKKGTYVVWGPPGCGKTTHLAEKTREFIQWAHTYRPDHRRPVLLCSLTRTAAAEIAGRDLPLPPECVGTLHSHAYRSLGCPQVAESLVGDFNQQHPAYRLSGAEIDTENPEWDRRAGTPGDELSSEYHLLRARMTDRNLWSARVRSFADRWESWKQEVGVIDFTDMIEMAWREVEFAPGDPKIIIADEAQDLSALEYALLKRWGESSGHTIITGDPYQALYTWRGAHPEVFLDGDIPAEHRRVLSQSYRVPHAVHKAAMEWVQQLSNYQSLDYKPRDHEGELIRVKRATWRAPERAVDLAEQYLDEGKSVMFTASCSFVLSPLLSVIRRRGLPFSNPWRRKRGDWNPLGSRGVTMARRITDYLAAPDERLWTYEELAHWSDVLKAAGVLQRGAKSFIASMKDRGDEEVTFNDLVQCFTDEAYADLLGIQDVSQRLDWWSSHLLPAKAKASRFPLSIARKMGPSGLTEPPRLHVGTIHSFKGAEADVVIVFPDLSPSGYREWNRRGEPKDSVIRLFYVALTRARETVAICDPGSDLIANLYPLLN